MPALPMLCRSPRRHPKIFEGLFHEDRDLRATRIGFAFDKSLGGKGSGRRATTGASTEAGTSCMGVADAGEVGFHCHFAGCPGTDVDVFNIFEGLRSSDVHGALRCTSAGGDDCNVTARAGPFDPTF